MCTADRSPRRSAPRRRAWRSPARGRGPLARNHGCGGQASTAGRNVSSSRMASSLQRRPASGSVGQRCELRIRAAVRSTPRLPSPPGAMAVVRSAQPIRTGLSGLSQLRLTSWTPYPIHEAKTQFSRLIARAEAGEEIGGAPRLPPRSRRSSPTAPPPAPRVPRNAEGADRRSPRTSTRRRPSSPTTPK